MANEHTMCDGVKMVTGVSSSPEESEAVERMAVAMRKERERKARGRLAAKLKEARKTYAITKSSYHAGLVAQAEAALAEVEADARAHDHERYTGVEPGETLADAIAARGGTFGARR